ncbi:MAG: helicase, partial [Chromatiaceae bacterium]
GLHRARLPRAITDVTLGRPEARAAARTNLVTELRTEANAAEQGGFDLDEVTAAELEEPPRPRALYDLADLRKILEDNAVLPPGIEIKPIGAKDFSYLAPGMPAPVRVTTDADYYDQHPDSTELWSPGSPLFPAPEVIASPQELEGLDWRALIMGPGSTVR